MLDRERGGLYPAFRSPRLCPWLITLAGSSVVWRGPSPHQTWSRISAGAVTRHHPSLPPPSQHLWATGLWRACPKLWSRTIAIRWNNASRNSAGNWRQYAGFQVGIQKKRGSGCSVPTPALPGANSHWISGESRGGEGSTLRRCWNDTKNGRKKFASDKGRFAETLHTTRTAILHGKPADRNVHFYFNTHFSSCSLLPRVHKPVPPKQTRAPHRNPGFRDTCDGGVLIGKLPCTSTLAQSVAAPAATARGAPALWPHEQSTFVSWGGKQRSSNVAPHPVQASWWTPWPQSKAQPQDLHNPIKCAPPFSTSPRRKTALPDVRH